MTNNSDRLREKGGGGPKSGKFCGRHLSIVPKGSSISYLRPFAKFSGFETRRRNVINITKIVQGGLWMTNLQAVWFVGNVVIVKFDT